MGKTINTRIQLKSDTELNWKKSVLSIDDEMGTKENVEGARSFVPQKGEAIIFEPDSEHQFSRLKIGDGITNVLSLPFIDAGTANGYKVEKAVPSDAKFTDTTYSSGSGINIGNNNTINHTNSITSTSNSEKKVYKITYDSEGHITDTEAINVGTVKSVQIQASGPLQSSQDSSQTESLNTTISFQSQSKNTVLAGPINADGSPSFRSLVEGDIPNLSASKITTGTFPEDQIGNLSASKITSGEFDVNRIPNLGPNKISGIIPVSKGGTGVDGVNGNLENNITPFFNNGIFAYDSTNDRFKQFGITALGNIDTFTDYINSLNGATGNLIVDLNTLIKAIPPINLNNPRDITENYTNSYYAPKTKGYENSVLISQGKENNNEGTEPIWLNPTALSAEGLHGGTLFYGRYSREVERIVDNETVTYTETGFETQWGTLPVEQGGTGVTNFNNDYVLIGSGENPIRTIAKTSSLAPNTIVERDTNGDFATRIITLSTGTGGLKNNSTETNNQQIISIDSSGISTHYGNLMADNLTATIGIIKMSKFNSNSVSEQPIIEWYKKESKNNSLVNVKVGELYWDYNKSNRGMLRNYYSSTNEEIYSDSYYLPAVDTSSTNNRIFTLLATDSISNVFPSNSILYSNGEVNKITYKESANGTLYSTSANGPLEWGTLPVAQGGTGFTTTTNINAVVIGNSTLATGALQTIATANGAFFATGNNSKPQFGILPVAQGGTGVTSIADIQAGKDGNGNTISSTYLKLSGGTLNGNLTISHATNGTMTADSTNPKITFSDSGTQPVHLIYTDHDDYRFPAGLKIVGGDSASPAWFEVEGQVYAAGFNGPLTGNAATATKLATARNINGTLFDGSAAITTANWGTARNITIKDASSTNAGTAVSVDGSSAITLLLPSTIKASITGNATSATKATQDGDGNTISSTYAKLSADNNLINHLNEFTFAASGQSGHVWFNYRTAGGTNGNITEYRFGDGKGGSLASITSGNFNGNAATATKATQDSNGANIANTYLKMNTAGGVTSCSGGGSNLYFKIATVKITGSYINRPIVFEISGRGWGLSWVQLLFQNSGGTDPGIDTFATNYYPNFWVKKTATSTWEIYGKYSEAWGTATLHRVTGCGADIGVTVSMINIGNDEPSGATKATYFGNVNYANNASKATQDGSGNTITSTYLKLSGGTLTGDLSIYKNFLTLSLVNDKYSGNHGLKSSGYGTYNDGDWVTWTEDEAWLIYRNANGNIIVNGNCTGSAGSVAWGNVTGKPGIIKFTNSVTLVSNVPYLIAVQVFTTAAVGLIGTVLGGYNVTVLGTSTGISSTRSGYTYTFSSSYGTCYGTAIQLN